MSLTKKAEAIRANKQDIASKISGYDAAIKDAMRECSSRLPGFVINGSHQTAVAFKTAAEAAQHCRRCQRRHRRIAMKKLSANGRPPLAPLRGECGK